jgi:predicted N-acyltransferase
LPNVQIIDRVTDVPAEAWDRLAGDGDPFLEHGFLSALEASGSVGKKAGCVPRIVLAREGDRLVGAVPLYLKTNSYGEFIFDWGWANAAARAGVRYYPKLVAAIPFTPATGRRLPVLEAPDVDAAAVTAALIAGVQAVAEDERASSIHFLFCTEGEKQALAAAQFFPRLSLQFHWQNRAGTPFVDFEDYLSTFRSQNRKQVRKERRLAGEHGLGLRTATGSDLGPRDWEALRTFYLANVERHGGIAYLTDQFFEITRATLAHRIVATLACRPDPSGDQPVAGTLNFEKGPHIYGRYWGCQQDYQMLHFELCYYRLIERAIERRCTRFEAGAQGEHKLKRGLAPAFTHSAHWIRHPGLAEAIDEYIKSEAVSVAERLEEYAAHTPFHSPRNQTGS